MQIPPVETSGEKEGGSAVWFLSGSLTFECSTRTPNVCIQFSVLFSHLPAHPERFAVGK